MNSGYILVDLDGTLARFTQCGTEHIGKPIPAMVKRVKQWLAEGKEVRIFTARMAGHLLRDLKTGEIIDALTPIEQWCKKHIGQVLPVTNVKDYGMIALYDDRAIQVEMNTGRLIGGE